MQSVCKFAVGRVRRNISNNPALAAVTLIGKVDLLYWGEAESGLAFETFEGNGLNVFKSNYDFSFDSH